MIFLFFFLGAILTLKHKVSVYYGNWKAYERAYPLCDIPFEKIDRLYYIFSDPTNGSCKFADTYLDLNRLGPIDGKCSSKLQSDSDPLKGNMYQLKVIKQNYPHLKVFFVIGGYGYTSSMHDYVMTNDTATMQAYVRTCVQMYQNYSSSFDGVDIDYEYPCLYSDDNCPDITIAFNEKKLFVDFIQEFRKQLGASVLISLTSSSEYVKIDALDLLKLDKIVDIYNIMTYDFTGGSQGDAYTGHHAQVKVNHDDPIYARRFLSAELASKYYVKSGASASKINIGVAFYGRGFLINDVKNSTGPFFVNVGAITVGTWDIGSIDYYDIKKNYMKSKSNNISYVYYDNESKAPYIINKERGMFITYDDEQSIQEKVNLVEANGYDGLFAYELTGDDSNDSLLNAMLQNPLNNATVNGTKNGTTNATTANGTTTSNLNGTTDGTINSTTNGTRNDTANSTTYSTTNGTTNGATNGTTNGTTNGSTNGTTKWINNGTLNNDLMNGTLNMTAKRSNYSQRVILEILCISILIIFFYF